MDNIEDLAEFVYRDEDNSFNLPSGGGSCCCTCCCAAATTGEDIIEEAK